MRDFENITRLMAEEALARAVLASEGQIGESLTQPTWFVDPANVTGNASDSNSGLTAAVPLLTFREIVLRWGSSSPVLAQNTTITFLSDQNPFGYGVSLSSLTNGSANFTLSAPAPYTLPAGTQVYFSSGGGAGVNQPGTPYVLANAIPKGSTAGLLTTPYTGTPATPNYMAAPAYLDPINITPVLLESSLFIVGTLNQVATDTLGTYTARNPMTGALDTITGTAIASFVPYDQLMIQDTTAGATFWILAEAGTSATISPPMATGTPFPPVAPALTAISPGDAIKILQPTRVFIIEAALNQATEFPPPGINNGLFLQNLWAVSYLDPSLAGDSNFNAVSTNSQQARIDAEINQGSYNTDSAYNCNLVGGLKTFSFQVYGGSVGGPFENPISVVGPAGAKPMLLDGFTVCTTAPAVAYGGALVIGACQNTPGNTLSIGGNVWISANARNPRVSYATASYSGATLTISISSGGALRIVNQGAVTAATALPSTGTAIHIDGATTGAGATQFSTNTAGVPVQYTGAFTPAALQALLGANSPATAAIQNLDTQSRFILNANNNDVP